MTPRRPPVVCNTRHIAYQDPYHQFTRTALIYQPHRRSATCLEFEDRTLKFKRRCCEVLKFAKLDPSSRVQVLLTYLYLDRPGSCFFWPDNCIDLAELEAETRNSRARLIEMERRAAPIGSTASYNLY